ncbi:MAG: c-type cytochrome [Bryobacteraceae bacterium]
MAAIMRFSWLAVGAFCLLPMALVGADAAKGKELFRACAGCHNYETDARKTGPSLRTLFGKVTLRNGTRATEENVRELILEGFNRMPSYRYQFRAEEFDDLLAFLKTLNARPEVETTAVTGKDLFAAYCARCHANQKSGGSLDGVVQKKGLTDAKLMSLIEDGHSDMKGTKNWLDAASTKTLLAYVKSL